LAREQELPSQLVQVFTPTASASSNTLTKKKQRVIIIGAGVVGISTAYRLAQQGHSVAILEPRLEPGSECTACAAGGMQISNPVVDKDSWIAVLKCIAPSPIQLLWGGQEDSFKFFQMAWVPTLSDPFFLRWVLTFTKTSLVPGREQQDKQVEMLDFTKFAVDELVKMLEDRWDGMGKKAGYNSRGSLSLSYEDPMDNSAAVSEPGKAKPAGNPTSTKRDYEPSKIISGEELLELEPSLRAQDKLPTSAKFGYAAKSASSGRFTRELARRCVTDPKLDVNFLYNTRVEAIKTIANSHRPRISELHTNRGIIQVPEDVKVVVAAGAWSAHVLALMDLYAPVYPLKGYAMSVSAKEALKSNRQLKPQDLPSRIVSDKYMYTTRLGDEIRITSIGEFCEWDTAPTAEVDHNFRQEAMRQFPQLKYLIPKAKTYCGHRPFISDGILLLGAVDTHDNLFVTCGPGSNGWKLALGSGEVMTRLVSGQTTDRIKQELGFDAGAFSPAGRVVHAPMFVKLCRARWDV
jgi:D-amino-acid dehydrogenase